MSLFLQSSFMFSWELRGIFINKLNQKFYSTLKLILNRHMSNGTYAIVSLMAKACIDSLEGVLYPTASEVSKLALNANSTFNSTSPPFILNPNYLSSDVKSAKIQIGTALTIYAGLIQVIAI